MAAEGQIPKKEGLRLFRTDEHAGGWLRGGKIRCCGRVTCCCLMLTIVIIISAVGSFFRKRLPSPLSRSPADDFARVSVYTRAPDITFNGIEPPLTGQQVDIQTGGFILNLGLNVSVFEALFSLAQPTDPHVSQINVLNPNCSSSSPRRALSPI